MLYVKERKKAYTYISRCEKDTANGFTVEYHKWYKLLHNHIKGETYALVCCGQPTTNFTGYNLVVNTPVTNVGVANAPSVLPFMEVKRERWIAVENFSIC